MSQVVAGAPPFFSEWLPVFSMLLTIGTCALLLLLELSRSLALEPLVVAGDESVARLRAEALRLKHRSLHDPLTGVANRELFHQILERELSSGAEAAREVAVIFCDFDRFKPVNDHFGHAAGDALLIEIARRLQGSVRVLDTVARLGGDEFAVVCPRLGREGAERVANHMREAAEEPFRLPAGDIVHLGLSLGIAAGNHSLTAVEMVDRADRAMYEDKRRRAMPSAPTDNLRL